MEKIEKNFFLIILLISLITFIFSSLRDIDFFGRNFDDKMALYYTSVIDIEKDKEKTRVKWKKMMDKLDSEFLDELASIKFASKMIEDEAENEKKL